MTKCIPGRAAMYGEMLDLLQQLRDRDVDVVLEFHSALDGAVRVNGKPSPFAQLCEGTMHLQHLLNSRG